MKYQQKTFSVGGYSKGYTGNYDRIFLGICQCVCHEKPILHDSACCTPCLKCKRNVVVGRITEHKKKCK